MNGRVSEGAYAESGVDTAQSDAAVKALVSVLRDDRHRAGRRARSWARATTPNVLRLDDETGLALSTDGVGTKVIVAEQLGRFDTVGIDCIAMNVNDLICVGAEPIALRRLHRGRAGRPGDAARRSPRASRRAPSRPASRSRAASWRSCPR